MINAKAIKSDSDYSWVVFLHGFGGSSDTWSKQVLEYEKHHNILLLNLHLNGIDKDKSKMTAEGVCSQISQTMEHYGVDKAHFVSISSGTLLALAFAALFPDRVLSMTMAGGIISFNLRTQALFLFALISCNVLPYMLLYKFFSYLIMPKANHRKSRAIFTREAKKIGKPEFCRWVRFIAVLKKNRRYIKTLNALDKRLPVLYLMGKQDHLFLESIRRDISLIMNSQVRVIPGSGHVCSIEKHEEFNRISLEYIKNAVS